MITDYKQTLDQLKAIKAETPAAFLGVRAKPDAAALDIAIDVMQKAVATEKHIAASNEYYRYLLTKNVDMDLSKLLALTLLSVNTAAMNSNLKDELIDCLASLTPNQLSPVPDTVAHDFWINAFNSHEAECLEDK